MILAEKKNKKINKDTFKHDFEIISKSNGISDLGI